MKRYLSGALVLALLCQAAIGCGHCNLRCGKLCKSSEECSSCEDASCTQAGPPQAAGHVAYPYYTLRGPRDFLYAE